ncbi:MAG: hypothetical protein MUC95_05395 [Spirochaetes bacterium]|jgi:hypothetical protein|nr:hypothetical protein [Spirochaetota bacterium]
MAGLLKNEELKKKLKQIFDRKDIPDRTEYIKVLGRVNHILNTEDGNIRPHDSEDLPGGMIILRHDIPAVIVPDIHARMSLVLSVMMHALSGKTMMEALALNAVQVICVGDGVHAEKRAAHRWIEAHREYRSDYSVHNQIDMEMRESLGTMEMIMEIKCAFPGNFHFLKGNHENISNEEGRGNHPFLKFSDEGAMVARYIEKFYGREFMDKYYQFEKSLPVFAVGRNFLISHAEPEMLYNKEEIIEYRNNPQVIEGLTWTANDASLPGSVETMIKSYIDKDFQDRSFYFGGHRPIHGRYNLRADGKYIQIHNPEKFLIALIQPGSDIDPDRDIFEIEDISGKII